VYKCLLKKHFNEAYSETVAVKTLKGNQVKNGLLDLEKCK